MSKEAPRLAVSAAIIVYFGWAVIVHWSAGIEQTVTNLAMMVVGYWLGSSKGSADNNVTVGKALDLAAANTPTPPEPDIMLKPGETAQAEGRS